MCEEPSLVCPAPGHVPHGVAPAPQHQDRQPQVPHHGNHLPVTSDAQVEIAESVSRQAVSSTLEHDHTGLVELHHALDDRTEHGHVAGVLDTLSERNIDRVVFAGTRANLKQVSGAGEEVAAVLVEADCHDSVRQIESLLDAVTVVNVDVDVEDSREVFEKLIDGKDDVIDEAEATGLRLLGMMQTPGPIDGNVKVSRDEFPRSVQRGPRVSSTEIKHPIKHRTVIANIEPLMDIVPQWNCATMGYLPCQKFVEVWNVDRVDVLEKLDVIFVMKLCDVLIRGNAGFEDCHLFVEVVVEH